MREEIHSEVRFDVVRTSYSKGKMFHMNLGACEVAEDVKSRRNFGLWELDFQGDD